MSWVLVALGSAIGGVLRYAAARYLPMSASGWPIATFAVNFIGSFAIGMLYPWIATHGPSADNARLFWMTGVLGGFTTYSAFALEATLLANAGNGAVVFAYVAATVLGCLTVAWAGRALMTAML
jgi:CrcB protein